MAARTRCDPVDSKLLTVDIRVAGFAFIPREFEVDVRQAVPDDRRFVATAAFNKLVRTGEREGSFEVIEAGEIAPGASGMAHATTGRDALGFDRSC